LLFRLTRNQFLLSSGNMPIPPGTEDPGDGLFDPVPKNSAIDHQTGEKSPHNAGPCCSFRAPGPATEGSDIGTDPDNNDPPAEELR
jgi:hypothetical protein